MKLNYIIAGLFVVLVLGSAAVASSNNDRTGETMDSYTPEMMEEFCTEDMMGSEACEYMEAGNCQAMMTSHTSGMGGCSMMNDTDEEDMDEEDDHMSSMMGDEGCSMMDDQAGMDRMMM